MRCLSRILISLPLAALPFLTASPHVSAAQAMRPSDAVRLLAQSRTADERCHYLKPADHQQLADYVARAEVAAARLEGVGTTKRALSRGNAEGKAMTCNARSKIVVTATLAAARQAEKQLGPQIASLEKKAKKQQRKRQAQVRSHKKTRVAALQSPAPAPAPADDGKGLFALSGSGSALDFYTRQAAAYYIERRCGFLSSSDTMAFWKLIVTRHNAMIARYGGAAVTRAKANAEQAGAAACSRDSAVFVRAAWSNMQRYR